MPRIFNSVVVRPVVVVPNASIRDQTLASIKRGGLPFRFFVGVLAPPLFIILHTT